MRVGNADAIVLFDAAAEALILYDAQDHDSLVALEDSFLAIREYFGVEESAEHPANTAMSCVARILEGDTTALDEIESAYAAARSRALAEARATAESNGSTAERTMRAGRPTHEMGAAPSSTMPLAGDAELLRDFVARATEHLDDADQYLLVLESDAGNTEAVDAVFRALHTIKGMAGFLSLDEVSARAHGAESLLAEARDGSAVLTGPIVQELFAAVDRLRGLVAGVADPVHPYTYLVAGAPERGAEELEIGCNARPPADVSRGGTVRIEEARLDGLLDSIGEMVIAESMMSAALRTGDSHSAVVAQLDRLDKITRELQQVATSLRMVPLRAMFRRMARVVRDTARRSGKDVEFIVRGEETELDKEVVDRIFDPLVHALRNAVDHGIEGAEARRAAGKAETGKVELTACHAGGSIHIEVCDDGRGMSRDLILEHAREIGIAPTDVPLTDEQILDLVFTPGFSTAEAVTDVSGRGVGMDVVRTAVEELRGRVELDSRAGEGTTLSLQLPLTLAIIDGMVVRVGSERYVIPVLSIERSVRPSPGQVVTVQGSGEMLVTDDGLVPIVRLHRFFSVSGATEDATDAVVVITNDSGVRAGLLVCELLGQQQTVIKPLGDGIAAQRGITGGAIMPDGRVGLIIDATGLVRLARERMAPGPETKGDGE